MCYSCLDLCCLWCGWWRCITPSRPWLTVRLCQAARPGGQDRPSLVRAQCVPGHWDCSTMIPEAGYFQPEVIPWTGPHPLTEELLFMKKKVVPFLLNHPYSAPFRYPVNAKAEGIYPDYFKVCIIRVQSFVFTISCLYTVSKNPSAFTLFSILISNPDLSSAQCMESSRSCS